MADELEYHLLLARDLHYFMDESTCERLAADVAEIKRMLTAFMGYLIPDT